MRSHASARAEIIETTRSLPPGICPKKSDVAQPRTNDVARPSAWPMTKRGAASTRERAASDVPSRYRKRTLANGGKVSMRPQVRDDAARVEDLARERRDRAERR